MSRKQRELSTERLVLTGAVIKLASEVVRLAFGLIR